MLSEMAREMYIEMGGDGEGRLKEEGDREIKQLKKLLLR
jgi:hypothetical protein